MKGHQGQGTSWNDPGRSDVNRVSYNEADFGRLVNWQNNSILHDDIERGGGTTSDDDNLSFEDAMMEEFHEHPPMLDASISNTHVNLPIKNHDTGNSPACTPSSPIVTPVANSQCDDEEEDFDMEVDWDGRSVSTSSSYYRYDILLEPNHIVCGRGVYRSCDHPGNITMHRIVQPYILPFGKATRDRERNEIIANILAEVKGSSSSFPKSPCFLVPAPYYDGAVYCRAATAEEIESEIHHCIRLHFNLIPTPEDVLFGRGEPIRDHPGNKKLRDFILPRRKDYAASNNKKAMVQAAMDIITQSQGRFLLPYNKSFPAEGCIFADPASVKEKIAHLFRNKKLSAYAELDQDERHSAARYISSTVVNHFCAALAIKSIKTSTSSITNTKETQATHAETKPPELIKIHDGPSISSTLDVHQEECNDVQSVVSANTLRSRGFVAKWSKYLIVAMIVLLILMGVVLGTVFAAKSKGSTNTVSDDSTLFSNETSLTLRTILGRGYIKCGITDQEGYATTDPISGEWFGFEVDLCRAVAAGIFGKQRFARPAQNLSIRANEPVKFLNVKASERFEVLNDEKVDLLLAITTQNMERNVHEPTTQKGYTFSTPYLVNGLIFAGHPDYLGCITDWNSTSNNNATDLGPCEDAVLCVLNGTTHESFIKKNFPGLQGRMYTPSTMDLLYDYFHQGVCNVLAGEQLELAPATVQRRGYYGPYEMGDEIFSKELISLVTRDGDEKFSDFCNWQIQGLFAAEEMRMMSSSDLAPSDILTTLVFGKRYETMFQDAFEIVGDYGQLYVRHLESLMPRFDANRLNLGDMPGMYAIEFGTVQTNSPPLTTESPKIREIKQRRLKCGITETPIFAELHGDDWVGLDVDYCKAISAALFDGKTTEVSFFVLDPSDRFEALLSGRVDVLARVTTYTMERDVNERLTGHGFSFAYPNFHDRIRFAGNPKYIECAENNDWTLGDCTKLQICVTASTTQHDLLSRMFPAARLVLSDSTSENVESFGDGKCQVLAAGSVEISKKSIEKYYTGEYEIGSLALSRESLALVTTEEDPLWSKFVNWVGIGLVYAEETGITQETSSDMPRIDLFGPLIGDQMLRHAIRAVGSYGEIWARNAAARGLQRDGRNELNSNPLGPMLISDLTWDQS